MSRPIAGSSNFVGRTATFLTLLALTGAALTAVSAAEQLAVKSEDRQITRNITRLMSTDHLTRHALDNEISQRWMTNYLKMLDPFKLYFTQSDIDEFAEAKLKLDDQARDLLKRSDNAFIGFAYKVFNRFLQRVDERVALIVGYEFSATLDE